MYVYFYIFFLLWLILFCIYRQKGKLDVLYLLVMEWKVADMMKIVIWKAQGVPQ